MKCCLCILLRHVVCTCYVWLSECLVICTVVLSCFPDSVKRCSTADVCVMKKPSQAVCGVFTFSFVFHRTVTIQHFCANTELVCRPLLWALNSMPWPELTPPLDYLWPSTITTGPLRRLFSTVRCVGRIFYVRNMAPPCCDFPGERAKNVAHSCSWEGERIMRRLRERVKIN